MKYQIIYKNNEEVLTTENRTHTTGVNPSERMLKNALHTICLDKGIKDFTGAKVDVFRNGEKIASYKLN